MTRDEIIAMAKEAGIAPHLGCTDGEGNHRPAVNALKTSVPIEWLERFAALVAAAEREACAKVAQATVCDTHIPTGAMVYGTRAATAIRARKD